MSDNYERRERTISGLKFRITLFFLFFFIAIFSVFVITSAMEVNTVVRFIGSRLGNTTVERAAELIDGDAFESLSRSLDKNDPFYEETRQKLLELKEATGCIYLYTMAPKGTMLEPVYRYIIDGSAPPDDEKNFSALGEEQDISEWGGFREALRSKTPQLSGIEQSDEWGQLISAHKSIVNSRGEVVGIIGCDLEAGTIISWIRNRVLWQVGIVAAFTLVGLIVYLSLLKRINNFFAFDEPPQNRAPGH